MAYNDDQAEIDAMAPNPVNMASMSSVAAPNDANAMLNENVSNLRSAISSLSSQVANLGRSTFNMAKSVGQAATKDVNIDVNGLGDRIAASMGGPVGLVVSRAFRDSGIADQIGGSVKNGIVSIGSKLKGAFGGGNRYDSQSGMINPAALSKAYGNQTATVVNALQRNVAQPLQIANGIHQQQLTQTKLGNSNIVSALQDFQKTARVDSSLNGNRLQMIDDTIKKNVGAANEDLINAINGLGSKFESSEKPEGLVKGLAKAFFFASKIGTLFRGKYTNDIQKSSNPLETQVSALLQLYRWQRLYGELTKKQLNELIKLQGGDQKDVVGKHGLLKETFLKNRKTIKKKLGKLGGITDFLMFDEEDFDDRNRAAMTAGMGQLVSGKKNKLFSARKKKDKKWYNPFDWIAGEDSAIGFADSFDTFNATYEEMQSMIDAQSSRIKGMQKTGDLAEKLKPIIHLRNQLEEQEKALEKINELEAKKKSPGITPDQLAKFDQQIESLKESINTVPHINKKIADLQAKLSTITNSDEYDNVLHQIDKLKKSKTVRNIDFSKIDYDDPLSYRLDALRRADLDNKSKKITGFAEGGWITSPVSFGGLTEGNTEYFAKGGYRKKRAKAIAGEAGVEAIVPVKKEKGNLTSKLAKALYGFSSKRDKKIIDLLSGIKSDTTDINSKLNKGGRKKTPAEKSLEQIAKATKATADAEEAENKEHSEDDKRAKKQGIWDRFSQGKGGKEKGGLFGAIGKVGAILTKFPLLIPALIAALLFPGATKSFAGWMFGGIDRFAKGLTIIGKVKNTAKAVGTGVVKGAYHMSKVVKNGVMGAKSLKAVPVAIKAGAKTLAPVKAVRAVSHLMKGGNTLFKSVGAVAKSSLAKAGAKVGLKGLIKRIPVIGSLLSIGFAISRFKKGEIRGGLLELLSGGLGLIDLVAPGLGTALSLGVDLLNIFLDNKKEGDKAKDAQKKGVADKAAEEKKKAEKLDKNSKEKLEENAQKARDYIQGGSKIRGAYYGYKAAKDLETEKGSEKTADTQSVSKVASVSNGHDDTVVETRRVNVHGTQIQVRKHQSGKISRRSSALRYSGADPDEWTGGKQTNESLESKSKKTIATTDDKTNSKKTTEAKAKDAQDNSSKFKNRKEVLRELVSKAKEIKDGKFSWLFGYPRFWIKARNVLKGEDINPEDVSYFRNNLRSIYDKADQIQTNLDKTDKKKNIGQKAEDIQKLKKRKSELQKKQFEGRFSGIGLNRKETEELRNINQKLKSVGEKAQEAQSKSDTPDQNDEVVSKGIVNVGGTQIEVTKWKSGKITRRNSAVDSTPIESRKDRSLINKDIRDTEKLNATNKVYAHRKANEQLNNSINDSANKTTNAIGMNSRNISNNISKVNSTVINNNNGGDRNESMYTPTLAVSGASV